MILLFAALSLADNNVSTFVTDPSYTPAPFAGLEQLDVDPVGTAAALKPHAEKPAGEAAADKPGHGQLVFTNPASTWAVVTVNEQRIGTIGPFATMRLDGISPGWYTVKTELPTGFARTYAVDVGAK